MNSNSYPTLIGGDYHIDYLILSKLPIYDIIILSNHEGYFSPMCADNYFWYLVANYHFPGVIPTAGTTWFELFQFLISHKVKDVNIGLELSAHVGNISLVEYFINKGANVWYLGMFEAAQGGYKDLIEFFINKGVSHWDFGMYGALKGGHRDLVEFFISKGANDWDWGIYWAEKGGHEHLVEYLRQKMQSGQ